MMPRRPYRACEVYGLRCHLCQVNVEVPVQSVKTGVGRCPKCDAKLTINWREPQ